ncbi:MAG: glycosyltransferase family 2 protein [Vicinamibacteria bacterium]
MKKGTSAPTGSPVKAVAASVVVENRGSAKASPITVSVSVYNYRQYIVPCLESVGNQTVAELDLVVVDDGSDDGSLEIVGDWLDKNGDRFNRYRLVRHEVNSGLAAARNSGFLFARTEAVFVLDADNLLYPRCLERLQAALDNSAASFAYCYLEKFGDLSCLQNTAAWDPGALQYGNIIDAMVLLRKKAWEEVGGYSRLDVMGWEDFDLWFKMARLGRWGVQIPEILARYRVHGQSMLKNVTNPSVDKLWHYLRGTYPEFFTDVSEATA